MYAAYNTELVTDMMLILWKHWIGTGEVVSGTQDWNKGGHRWSTGLEWGRSWMKHAVGTGEVISRAMDWNGEGRM